MSESEANTPQHEPTRTDDRAMPDGRDLTMDEIEETRLLDAFIAYEEMANYVHTNPEDVVRVALKHLGPEWIDRVRAFSIGYWALELDHELIKQQRRTR